MLNQLVTINLVVLNGEKYIRHCLDAILVQTYPHEFIELNILDNGSTDRTKEIIKELLPFDKLRVPKFTFVESKVNLGMWLGQEELLRYSNGKYILAMAVDVILDKNFIKNAIEVMEKDDKIGALQAKIYKYDLIIRDTKYEILNTNIVDTCGFQIFKSRRVINIGHGEEDRGQFSEQKEIFGVEGAAPFFRRSALESCKIRISTISAYAEIVDHNFFWYGDDLDLAWRMRLFGWKEIFAPSVVAWHDRQTTKSLKKNWLDYIFRVPVRRQIPIRKRRLDWRNTRFTIVKNDYIINILKDLPRFALREIIVLIYAILFEQAVLLEIPNFLKLLPKMLKKRKKIMEKAVIKPQEIHKWFIR